MFKNGYQVYTNYINLFINLYIYKSHVFSKIQFHNKVCIKFNSIKKMYIKKSIKARNKELRSQKTYKIICLS